MVSALSRQDCFGLDPQQSKEDFAISTDLGSTQPNNNGLVVGIFHIYTGVLWEGKVTRKGNGHPISLCCALEM